MSRADLMVAPEGSFLRVNEIFKAHQGEGPWSGRYVHFLRLTGCNLDCSWCDTPYTWDWDGKNGQAYDREQETKLMSVDEILHHMPGTRTVISGGEPMLQSSKLLALFDVASVNRKWQIETNGTRPPIVRDNVLNVVSPKLANSGIEQRKRLSPTNLRRYAESGAHFKFVVADETDLAEVELIVKKVKLLNSHVWLMPEGATVDLSLWRKVSDWALSRSWNFSARTHALLWGDQRER